MNFLKFPNNFILTQNNNNNNNERLFSRATVIHSASPKNVPIKETQFQ